MGMTVPAFKGIGKTYAMRGAVNQVRSSLALARQHAILNNVQVAFLIPDPDLIPDYGRTNVTKCLRAYAIYDVTNGRYIKNWTYLPKGIVFDYFAEGITPPSGFQAATNYFGYRTHHDVSFPDDDGDDFTFVELDFLNDGSSSITDPVAIVLTEGSVFWPETGTGLDPNEFTQYMLKPDGITNAIIVSKASGRLQVITE